MTYQIPQNVRAILTSLAEAVFPVEAWTIQKAPPKNDQLIPVVSPVPWRPAGAAPTLSTANFEIATFLENLFNNDAANVALSPRWNAIRSDPTQYFKNRTGQSSAQWRAGRNGLLPATKFGVFEAESSNFAFVTQAADGTLKDAVSRVDFYEKCWPPLVAAYQANQPKDAAGWIALRDSLRSDQLAVWPATNAVKSSVFLRQFTVDVLNGCLGQKNSAINDPVWQRAVLIELGENRHCGNAYTEQQAAKAVATFKNAI